MAVGRGRLPLERGRRYYASAVAPTLPSLARLERPTRPTRSTLALLAIYVALACLIFWPATPWNNTRLPSVPFGGFGYGDPAVDSWFLGWTPFALSHGMVPFHTSYIDFPQGANLASNTLTPLLGLLAWPVTSTLGPVAAFNVLLRLAFAASAGTMFLVLRTWCRPWIAFIGGLFFGFGPYMVTQITHLNLVFTPLLPLIVLVVVRLLSPSVKDVRKLGVQLGVLSGAQLLICPELLAMLGIVCAIGVVYVVARDGPAWKSRATPILAATPWALGSLVVVAGYFLFWAFAGSGHVSGPPQPVASLQTYRTDLLAPVVPTLNQALLPRSLLTTASHFDAGNFTENDGYLGVGLIAWVIVVAARYRRSKVVVYSALAAASALVLSFGPRLTINGTATGVPLPEALFARLPVLQGFVPSRFAEIAALFVAIAGSVGAEHFVRGLKSRPAIGRRIGDMGMVLLAGVALALPFPQLALVTKSPQWPHGLYGALERIPRGEVVLAYPYPADPYTEAMSWQAEVGFRFKLLGGYMDIQGPGHQGEENPLGLAPVQVQGFLMDSLYGYPRVYPVPSPRYDLATGLCTFVRRYHVGALVYWRTGAHPERVRRLFARDFGRPRASASHGAFEVWRTTPGACARG